jgi:hypothetical protein
MPDQVRHDDIEAKGNFSKLSGSMLKDIGAFFSIGGSGVSQAVRRAKQKFE